MLNGSPRLRAIRLRAIRLRAIALITLPLIFSIAFAVPPGIATERIAIDQFGYLPAMKKVAVISDPQSGFNQNESYTPGDRLEVRRWADNRVVFTGSPTSWNNGAGP